MRPVQSAGANYTFPDVGWQDEILGWPRVMGDATVLPNGDVILLNGASQVGAQGQQQGRGCRLGADRKCNEESSTWADHHVSWGGGGSGERSRHKGFKIPSPCALLTQPLVA